MPDQNPMWTRCLGGFSVMWVTKLLISPVKKGFFVQKQPNLAWNWHFCPLLAHLVANWWVCCWLWRAGCISQDTYLLYYSRKLQLYIQAGAPARLSWLRRLPWSKSEFSHLTPKTKKNGDISDTRCDCPLWVGSWKFVWMWNRWGQPLCEQGGQNMREQKSCLQRKFSLRRQDWPWLV